MSIKVALNKNGVVVAKKALFIPSPLITSKPAKELSKLDKALSNEPLNIAVIRSQGGIGDVLMTFPTVKAIKKKYNCVLTYVTDKGYLSGALYKCAEHNPYIDRVIDNGIYKEEQYDISINLTCPCVAHEKPGAQPIHRIDLFSRSCGLDLVDRQIDLVLTPEEIAWGREFFDYRQLKPEKCILVQPYASHANRSYDIKRLQRSLMQVLDFDPTIKFLIIRHGTDFDRETNWDLRNIIPVKDYDIISLASIAYHSRLVLCPDSAMLHVAGALSKDIVAFFGPTDHRARMYPNMIAISPAEGWINWPYWYAEGGHVTWNALQPEMVSDAIKQVLNVQYTIPNTFKIEQL